MAWSDLASNEVPKKEEIQEVLGIGSIIDYANYETSYYRYYGFKVKISGIFLVSMSIHVIRSQFPGRTTKHLDISHIVFIHHLQWHLVHSIIKVVLQMQLECYTLQLVAELLHLVIPVVTTIQEILHLLRLFIKDNHNNIPSHEFRGTRGMVCV